MILQSDMLIILPPWGRCPHPLKCWRNPKLLRRRLLPAGTTLPRPQARCGANHWLGVWVLLSSLHPESQWLGPPVIRLRESHDAGNHTDQ